MNRVTPAERLRAFNSILTAINPNDPRKINEVQKAVDFFIDEIEAELESVSDLPVLAKDIVSMHTESGGAFGLCFLAIGASETEPLWLRASFLKKLEELEGFNNATIVIFGLEEAFGKDGKYWTQKLKDRFEETKDYLDNLAANWQQKGCRLNILYL